MLGIINAFDVHARQPMVHEMVDDKADLANAISLNSAMVNLARLIGPALSGMVLQRWGAGFCFSLNAVSFIAVIWPYDTYYLGAGGRFRGNLYPLK